MELHHRLTGSPRLAGATAGRAVARLRAPDEHAAAEAARRAAMVALVASDPASFDGLASVAARLTAALVGPEQTTPTASTTRPIAPGPATAIRRLDPRPAAVAARDGRALQRPIGDGTMSPENSTASVIDPISPKLEGRARVAEPSHWTDLVGAATRLSASARARPVSTPPSDVVTRSATRWRATGEPRSAAGIDHPADAPIAVAELPASEPPTTSSAAPPPASPISSPRSSPLAAASARQRVRSLADLAHLAELPHDADIAHDAHTATRDRNPAPGPVAGGEPPPTGSALTTTAREVDGAVRPVAVAAGVVTDTEPWPSAAEIGGEMGFADAIAVLVGEATAAEARRAGIDLEGVAS